MKNRIDPYQDFRNFLFLIWKHLNLPEPTPVQYDIGKVLQNAPKKLIIEAFRGVGKSYILVAYCAWRLYLDPQIKIMVVSAGKERADAFSIFLKQIINEIPMLNHLKANSAKGQRDSNVAFDVGPATPSGSPSVKSVGITGQLTGSRANLIIADDIEIPSNSATHELREKLQELVKEFAAVLSPNGQVIYLGTPQTEMSLYNALEARGYRMIIWTARYPESQDILKYGSRLADFILDRIDTHDPRSPVDPLRFDEETLVSKELEYGRSGFALQFMLDTSLSDANKYPLKINDLIIMGCNLDKAPREVYWSNNPVKKLSSLPNLGLATQSYYAPESCSEQFDPYSSSILVIDPSGRGKDETAFAVLKMCCGNVYVPKLGGLKGGYDDTTLISLCNIAKSQKVNKILIESNFGDGMFSQLLRPHLNRIYPCAIEEVRQTTQKELRIINALEPIMNQHRLIIDPQVIIDDYNTAKENYTSEVAPQYMLIYQLTRVTKERGALKHDDRLDVLAMGVQHFVNMLGLDQQAANKKRLDDAWDKEVENWLREIDDRHSGKKLTFHDRLYNNIKTGRFG